MSVKVQWYTSRCWAWLSALVAAGGLADPVKASIAADLRDLPVSDEDAVARLAVMVSWLESLVGMTPAEDKVKINRLLHEIKQSQEELLR